MDLSSKAMLGRLGAGESIDSVCRAAGISRSRFDAWWKDETTSRLGDEPQEVAAAVQANVDIDRDQFGIPHIDAAGDHDLWFGFGYAMAQDRLFQLDFLRRKAAGRLSEILGPDDFVLGHQERSEAIQGLVLPVGGVNLDDVEEQLVRQALARVSENRTQAAKLLNLSRDQLRYRMEKYGITAP